MAKQHNYIMLMYDDRYKIAGPFSTTAALKTFGDRWQAANCDRPTWQSIYLDDPYAKPTVILTQPEEQ